MVLADLQDTLYHGIATNNIQLSTQPKVLLLVQSFALNLAHGMFPARPL